MNGGAFGENFPYSNFHDLNMDWIIKIAKDFLDQYTNIQQTITEGLEGLDNKAQELEALLQEWYDTHSEDIANQLADALNDLNNWYTEHEGYLDQYVTDSIQEFNDAADRKAAQTIASIPADYTTLANDVTNVKSALTDLYDSTIPVFMFGGFAIGDLNPDGSLKPSVTYRVSSTEEMTFDEEIRFYIAAGYRIIVNYYENGTQTSTSGWTQRAYTIPAGSHVKMVIAKVTENSSVPANILVFTSAITTRIGIAAKTYGDFAPSCYIDYKFNLNMERGSLNNSTGNINLSTKYRIATVKPLIIPNYNLYIIVNSGYRFEVYKINDDNTIDYSGWRTTPYKIPAGTKFAIQLARRPDDSTLVIENIEESDIYNNITIIAKPIELTGLYDFLPVGLKSNVINDTYWSQGACVVGDRILGFGGAADDHSEYANIIITTLPDLVKQTALSLRHNLSHAPSADYASDTDTILVSNGNTGVTDCILYLVNGGANFAQNGGVIAYGSSNVIAINFSDINASGVACFGETSDIVYMVTGESDWTTMPKKRLYRVILGKGANDLTSLYSEGVYGSFIAGKADNEYNGTAHITNIWDGAFIGELQGMKYRNGNIIIPSDVYTNHTSGKTPYLVMLRPTNNGTFVIDNALWIPVLDEDGSYSVAEPQDVIYYNGIGYVKALNNTYKFTT